MKKYLSVGFMSMLILSGLMVANKASAIAPPPDTTPPTVGVITITPSVLKDTTLYIGNQTTISAPVFDEEGGSGIDPTSCVYVIDGGHTSGTIVPTAYNGTNCVFSNLDTSGAYGSLNVKIKDLATNPAIGTWTVFTLDNTAPEIALHDKITVEAISTSANISTGVVVDYTAPDATDDVDATAPAVCLPASGSLFPFGITSVKCNKTDTLGNVATETNFDIKVQDTTDPEIVQADGSYSIKKTGPNTIEVLFDSELQNENSGHHPSSYDFYVYNDVDGSGDRSDGDVSYGIEGDVYYSNVTNIVIMNLTNSIQTGDKPRLHVMPEETTLIDLAGNYFNSGGSFDQPVIDSQPRGGGAIGGNYGNPPPTTEPPAQTPPPAQEQPPLPPTSPAPEVLGAETYQFTRTLRRGMKGDDVLELHKKLAELGFYKGPIDDIFGKGLEKAVKEYQKANPPLKIDGIVGPKTRAVLNK